MRIARIDKTVVAVPLRVPIASFVRQTDRIINVLVEVHTDEEVSGISYVAGFTAHKAAAVCALLDDLADAIHGQDPRWLGAIWQRMWAASTLVGHAGVSVFAISAIDIALWDLHGKLLGAPVHRLLGTHRTRIEAYASDGCWLHDPRTVASEAAQFAEAGFRAIKVRVGRREMGADEAVLDAVRQAVGDSTRVIVDANQAWSRIDALNLGRRLLRYTPEWLEEPLAAEDVEGLADLHRALPVPIVAGENAYLPDGIRALVDAGAVSMVMADLQRIGGITGWVRAHSLAEARHIPITSHLFPEVSVHVLASSGAAGPLEWVSWMTPVLEEPLSVDREGTVEVPMRPGLGLRFDHQAVRRYQIA